MNIQSSQEPGPSNFDLCVPRVAMSMDTTCISTSYFHAAKSAQPQDYQELGCPPIIWDACFTTTTPHNLEIKRNWVGFEQMGSGGHMNEKYPISTHLSGTRL